MSNALVSYQFDEEPVRVVMVLDAPWFVAGDCAKVLGYQQAAFMTRNLDEDEKGLHIVQTLGGNQELTVISESGLYAAIFKSRRAEAQRFRKWVTSEVLPELRRTGKYQLLDEEPPQLGSAHDPVRLNAFVATVREGRRLWGPEAARNMWVDLGLPLRLADARGHHQSDAIAAPVKAWLEEHETQTLAEITGGIGLDPEDAEQRRRVAAVLRLLGWWTKRSRRGSQLIHGWFPPHSLRGED